MLWNIFQRKKKCWKKEINKTIQKKGPFILSVSGLLRVASPQVLSCTWNISMSYSAHVFISPFILSIQLRQLGIIRQTRTLNHYLFLSQYTSHLYLPTTHEQTLAKWVSCLSKHYRKILAMKNKFLE